MSNKNEHPPEKSPQSKGWSEERRARHAASIHKWAPWLRSTGPSTDEGKARSSRNAYKHGKRSIEARTVRGILANQKRLHTTVARYVRQKTANELLNDRGFAMLDRAVGQGIWLIENVVRPIIMQKPCIFAPPDGKS